MKKRIKEIQVNHTLLTGDILEVEVLDVSKADGIKDLRSRIELEEAKIKELLQTEGISKKNANLLDSFLSDYERKKTWLDYLHRQSIES